MQLHGLSAKTASYFDVLWRNLRPCSSKIFKLWGGDPPKFYWGLHFRRVTRPEVFRFSGFWFSRLFRRTRLTRQTRPRPARPPTSPDSSDGPLRWTARRPRQLRYPDSSRRPVRPPPAQTDLQTDYRQTYRLWLLFFSAFFSGLVTLLKCKPQ